MYTTIQSDDGRKRDLFTIWESARQCPEACEKVTDKERKKISIKIEQHMQMLFLEIKNGTDKLPAKSGHTFLTSKQDKSLHGYGLKSVERIVTRYDGDLAYEMEDGMFVVSITFFDL